MGRQLTFEAIKALVPQRFPLLCVDRVLDYVEGRSLIALKNISGNDVHFMGHFPQLAVMPGALLLEGIAQSMLVLYQLTYDPFDRDDIPLFGSVDARFLHPVFPGDQVIFEVEARKLTSTAGLFVGVAKVAGETVVTARLGFGKRRSATATPSVTAGVADG